jgi:hypothetical protein
VIQKLLQYEKLKNRLVSFFLLVVIIVITTVAWLHYNSTKEMFHQRVNRELLRTARNLPFVVGVCVFKTQMRYKVNIFKALLNQKKAYFCYN